MWYWDITEKKPPVLSFLTVAGPISIGFLNPSILISTKIFTSGMDIYYHGGFKNGPAIHEGITYYLNATATQYLQTNEPQPREKLLNEYRYYFYLALIVIIFSNTIMIVLTKYAYQYFDIIAVTAMTPVCVLCIMVVVDIFFIGEASKDSNLPMFFFFITIDVGCVYTLLKYNSSLITRGYGVDKENECKV